MRRLRTLLQPGVLAPLILAAAVVADLGLRALPLEHVSYRVWEALRTFGSERPFRPNARYDRPRVYGNLAALGNQLDLRQYHRVVFLTDSLGYGNAPEIRLAGSPLAFLFGSSFSAGTEVSDGEGLAARLSALTGRVVYNAAPGDPAPALVRELANAVGAAANGFVIYEFFEGSDVPRLDAVIPNPGELRCRSLRRVSENQTLCDALNRLHDWHQVNPLQVFASRAHRRVQNDLLLPNPAAHRIVRSQLVDGSEMLFLGLERDDYHRARDPAPAERYFTWLANRLRLQGHELLVVLMPSKYTVYAPLLATPDTGPARSVGYLAELERRLQFRGIAVVNLVATLRAAAQVTLAADSLIYWRDDTHWNAAGVAVAARAIAPQLTAAAKSRAIARP